MCRGRREAFDRFRRDFPTFVYESCRLEMGRHESVRPGSVRRALAVDLRYRIPGGPRFGSRYTIQLPPDVPSDGADHVTLSRLAFCLGLVDLISYWKCVCSPTIVLEAGAITQAEASWWRGLVYHGLGEFRYVNGIDIDEAAFVVFEDAACVSDEGAGGRTAGERQEAARHRRENLILVGGGKDSVVSLELLAGRRDQNTCLALNPRTAIHESLRVAGYGADRLISVMRPIDPTLLELNAQGYLNGHTPFSAILAFLGLLVAAATGHRHVIASNESSASEGNVTGGSVNHQYSKSVEFELGFRDYVRAHLPTDVEYFSLLRPWNELRIAREFARHPTYLDAFKSCNAGSSENRWCGQCPKCLFVYLVLAPFVASERLQQVFGDDLLARGALRDVFLGLVDPARLKPFECVGTREEANAAAREMIRRYHERGVELPALLGVYEREIGDRASDDTGFAALLERFDTVHAVPDGYLALLEAPR